MLAPASLAQDLLHTHVATIRGVGKQTLARLQQAGLSRLLDLVLHFPVRYQDRTRVLSDCPSVYWRICGDRRAYSVF